MRYTTALTSPGGSRPRTRGVRRTAFLIVVAIAALWTAYAYAQELFLEHRLSQQVADLRHQNGLLAAQNQGYHKDIKALMTGTADEEEARLNGYSKPQERLYLVAPTPSPTPAAPSPTAPASPSPTH